MYAYEESDKNVINACEMCNLISLIINSTNYYYQYE